MQLVNPLFLIGLLAVALPIAVHLFNFRRYKKIYFSNVSYLQELQSETRQRSRLRELLILAARCLFVVFLVLAFAQPFIPNRNSKVQRGGSAVSIYIDNSYSMANTNSEGTLLEMAKQKAREIADAYKPSDNFQLITNQSGGTAFRWLNKEELMEAIDQVESTPACVPLADVAAKQYDFLRSAKALNRYAYLVSDFQQTTSDLSAFPADSTINTTFVPLEATSVSNVYIDSLSLNAPTFFKGSNVTALVRMQNDGDAAVEKLPLKLYINDRQRALASVDMAAHSSATVEMRFTIEETGILNGRIETADYPITFDDQYFFSLNIGDRTAMTVINGRDENPYLHKLFFGDSAVAYHSVTQQGIDFDQLASNNLVVLNELVSIPSGLSETLLRFVDDGGSLLVIPSAQSDVASYNAALQLFHAPQLDAFREKKQKASVVNTQSSLYRNVFASENDDMERPSVFGLFGTKRSASTVKETIIATSDGSDLLTATQCGNGKVYLFMAPLQPQYTDLVQQALFVPTLYNMALYSRTIGQAAYLLDYTDPIPLSISTLQADEPAHLRSADGSFDLIPDVRVIGSRRFMLPHSQVEQAGNYTLSTKDESEGLSFNSSRQESRMQFFSRSEVASMAKNSGIPNCSVVRNAQKPLNDYIRQQANGRQLWRLCLALALLMLAAEILLIRLPQPAPKTPNK